MSPEDAMIDVPPRLEQDARSRGEAGPVPDPRRWRLLGVLSMALFMALLDISIVTVALPSIQSGIGATESDVQWILAGYALAFGVLQVAAGRAGDVYGRGGLFIAGVVVFTGASVGAGLAGDPLVLNIARGIQGLGAGILVPQVVGMIQQYFRGAERGRAFGIFGGVVGVAVATGPTLAGVLIHIFGVTHGWRAVFFVNAPVGIVAIALALAWFPRPLLTLRGRSGETVAARAGRDLDLVGTILLGLAVLALLLPFVESHASPLTWATLPAGLAALALWVGWERRYQARGRSPMVDLAIFRVPSFRNGTLLLGLYFFAMSSIWVILNLYLQQGLGFSALASGLLGLPSAILTGLTSVWAGHRVARYGRMIVVAGIYVAIVGLVAAIVAAYLQSTVGTSAWWLMPALAIFGAGGGAVVSPNQTLTLEDVPLAYAGSSGGIMQTAQQIGASVGLAIVTAISFAVLAATNWPTAFVVGLVVIAFLLTWALAVAHVDLRHRRPKHPSGADRRHERPHREHGRHERARR